MYGGWTLVRGSILSTFYHSKDAEFLTIFNIVDNYVPLVLSVYSKKKTLYLNATTMICIANPYCAVG